MSDKPPQEHLDSRYLCTDRNVYQTNDIDWRLLRVDYIVLRPTKLLLNYLIMSSYVILADDIIFLFGSILFAFV